MMKKGYSMAPHADAAVQRLHMVDCQVRPNQVNDRRILDAMRALPREAFAPPGAFAYADADIALGEGRYMPAPMLIGRLTQLVMADNPAHVLVIAAGSGYGAAVLALAGAHVVALEEDERLTNEALARHAPAVEAVRGKLAGGWPAGGPYDAILIEGAVQDLPDGLIGQLTPQGRLVTVIAVDPGLPALGHAVLAEPSGGAFVARKMFDCTARLLPAFRRAPQFVF
jgi:protein-L-isoaspartate(D-aspartate) O-methyltransferase